MVLYNPGPSTLAVNQSTIKIIHYKHNHGISIWEILFALTGSLYSKIATI